MTPLQRRYAAVLEQKADLSRQDFIHEVNSWLVAPVPRRGRAAGNQTTLPQAVNGLLQQVLAGTLPVSAETKRLKPYCEIIRAKLKTIEIAPANLEAATNVKRAVKRILSYLDQVAPASKVLKVLRPLTNVNEAMVYNLWLKGHLQKEVAFTEHKSLGVGLTSHTFKYRLLISERLSAILTRPLFQEIINLTPAEMRRNIITFQLPPSRGITRDEVKDVLSSNL